MKIKIMVAVVFLSFSGWAQTIIFSENMGNPIPPGSDPSIPITSNAFENQSKLSFSGTADVRNSAASSGYTDASGSGNVFFTYTANNVFVISGIDTSNFYSLNLTLAHFKTSTSANNELAIEVSADGINYMPLIYDRPTGDGTTGWILITPLGTIPSTTNLSIRFTQTSNIYNYYFRIDDVVLTGTQRETKTWTGSNWIIAPSPTVVSAPTATDVVIFNGSYPALGDLSAYSCTVNTGVNVDIKDGATLTLTNGLTVNGTLIFENNASLVQENNVVNVGDIKYKRITYARNSDYTYISSPVSSQKLGGLVSLPTASFYSYEVSETEKYWHARSALETMETGRGYIAARNKEILTGDPASNELDLFYTGEPNNGPYEISGVIAAKPYLLGNPYPSAIDADAFLNANSGVLEGTLYFWTHNTAIQDRANITDGTAGTGAFAYTSNDYASYNLTGGVATAAAPSASTGGANANIPTGYIAAGQGFFATCIASGTVVFNNNMRVGGITLPDATKANQQFFKTRLPKTETVKSIEKNRIWLDLKNSQGAFKQTLVGYITDATNEFDNRFDGENLDGNDFVNFYSVNNNKNLTIQGRALPFDENDEVPLGYSSSIEGDFTITIDQVDGLLTNQAVFIEDKLTNTTFDLKTGDYTFTTAIGTFDDRFVLRYTEKTLGTNDLSAIKNKVLVSCKNKQIKVNSFLETINKVTMYDLLGRQIYQKDKLNSNEFSVSNLNCSRQTIVVKTSLQNGSISTDKIIFQ